MPPRFQWILAEEEPAENGEHKSEDGNIDEILHDTVAVNGIQWQFGVHGHVEYVCAESSCADTDYNGDNTLSEEEQWATLVNGLDIKRHGEP